ncbi:MAG: DUF4952 domain-containing protein [Blastocatellia bacterium]
MQKIIYIFISLFLLSQLSCVKTLVADELNKKNKTECDDFLAKIGKKPKDLLFIECERTNQSQIDVFKASYKVLGTNAAQVENYLQNTFQMPKLHFVCCGWETSPDKGIYKNSEGFDYQIEMWSEETIIGDRNEWEKIHFFYVSVTLPLEKP